MLLVHPTCKQKMHPHEAVDLVIKLFSLKASTLAKAAGVDASELSAYRRGRRDWNSTKLWRVLQSLTPEQFGYFCGLIYPTDGEDVG